MKKLFNYAHMPQFPLPGLENVGQLNGFLQEKNLTGVEMIVWDNDLDSSAFKEQTVGVHLKYWPTWLPIYEGSQGTSWKGFRDKNLPENFCAVDSFSEWLEQIKANVRAALRLEPEYLVWHVADCTVPECFSFQFQHSNMDVLRATVDIVPEIFAEVPGNVKILFENLWWPGLNLLHNKETEWFFDSLADRNVGLMLDTGHLLNTDYTATCEQECIRVLLKRVREMGELKQVIKGMHLNLSVSAAYRRSCWGQSRNSYTPEEIGRHIGAIDQHRGFCEPALAEFIELVQPEYVNNELLFSNREELSLLLTKQLKAAGL